MQSRIRYSSAVDGIVASFAALAVVLTLYLALLGALWGPGPVVAVLPLYVPVSEGFALVLALGITHTCYGRYLALGEPTVLLIALALWAYAILATLFILTFPGLVGQTGLYRSVPEIAGWLHHLKWTALAVGLLAAFLAPPRAAVPRNLPFLFGVVGALILSAGLVVVAEQGVMPPLMANGLWTGAADLWAALLALAFVGSAALGLRRYLRERNRVVGYAAQLALFGAAIMAGSVIGGQPYDLWFYLDRVLLDFGLAWMLYGIMAEYADMYRESETRRVLAEAMLDNAPAAIALLRPPDFRLETANPAFAALAGSRSEPGRPASELWPLVSRELIPLMDRVCRSGKAHRLEDVAWPLASAADRLPTEHHFAVSLIPLLPPGGRVERVLLMLHETTAEVLSVRRLEALVAENARLYEEVQRTLQLREEFLRDSAHELRTPVTSIKGYSQLLLKLVPEEDQRLRQMAEGLAHQSERLARLVQDLLEVAEFHVGQPVLHRESFDLSTLAHQVVASVKRDRGQEVVLQEGRPLMLNADRAQLRRVLEDLLRAALRSAPEGTEVGFEIALEDGFVQVSVHDQGVAIPAKRQSHVFEPFYPIWGPGEEGYSPSRGVGLYIDKAIVEGHGGVLWFDSQEGKGTTFFVRLPMAK